MPGPFYPISTKIINDILLTTLRLSVYCLLYALEILINQEIMVKKISQFFVLFIILAKYHMNKLTWNEPAIKKTHIIFLGQLLLNQIPKPTALAGVVPIICNFPIYILVFETKNDRLSTTSTTRWVGQTGCREITQIHILTHFDSIAYLK